MRYAYTKDLEGYIRGVRDHAPMLSESDRIPPLDRDTEWVMLGLRTTAGLDPKAFERRFRRRFTCFLPFLDQCARAGYAVAEDGRWAPDAPGFLVSNQIIGGCWMPWPRTNSGGRCRRPGRFPGEPGLNEKSRPLECSGGRFFLMPSGPGWH